MMNFQCFDGVNVLTLFEGTENDFEENEDTENDLVLEEIVEGSENDFVSEEIQENQETWTESGSGEGL